MQGRATGPDVPRTYSRSSYVPGPQSGAGCGRRSIALTAAPGATKTTVMSGKVKCVKLGFEADALDRPPFKGDFGQKIFENVSKQAWATWLEHSKMLINEFRLDLTSLKGQEIWMTECERYFFGDGSHLPPDYVPEGEGGSTEGH